MSRLRRVFGKLVRSAYHAIWKQVRSLVLWLQVSSSSLPSRTKDFLFRLGQRGKLRLDHYISSEQRESLYRTIYKTDSPEGRRFDRILIWLIMASVVTVMMESVTELHRAYWWIFFLFEWLFTLVFTVEYILRLYSARSPWRYATSFFGIVDLLAILPTFLSIFFLGAQHLLMIRILRLLRVFRIFKMGHFVKEGALVVGALRASRTKIYVFVAFVLLMAMLIGTLMYMVEGSTNAEFSNIPQGIYWAIVTLTTVGYGDITPVTGLGKFFATLIMILGYGVIAVPTGIVTAEISGRVMNLKEVEYHECDNCGQQEHHSRARFCHHCGSGLITSTIPTNTSSI